METIFENNLNEITQIISRAKKEKNTVVFDIQKVKLVELKKINDQPITSYRNFFHTVGLTMYSASGYVISGNSDRIYLTDVITRLYQNLDNVLKANKGHKVKKNIKPKPLPTKKSILIEHIDLQETDFSFINTDLTEIYSKIKEISKDSIQVQFSFTNEYRVDLRANSEGGQEEYDSSISKLYITASNKKNPYVTGNLTFDITVAQLRSQRLAVEDIIKQTRKLLTSREELSVR